MKQAFLSTISDELRAPIESVRDCLTQLSSGSLGGLSEEATLRAQRAERTLARLIELMNDMLALQAPGPGRVEIRPRMCILAEVIDTSIDAVPPSQTSMVFALRARIRESWRTQILFESYRCW